MSEPGKRHEPSDDSRMMVTISIGELRALVREAVREEFGTATKRSESDADGLMDVKHAAEYLSVTPSWLYKNASSLPFSKKIGGALRFDKCGMRRWLENQRR